MEKLQKRLSSNLVPGTGGVPNFPHRLIGALKVVFILQVCSSCFANAIQNWTQLDGCGAWFGTELDAVLKSPHKSLLAEIGADAGVVTGAGESKSKRISASLPPWFNFGMGGGVT